MLTSLSKPIFIHSLFRAGSTYIFEVFRRSNHGYWCYQEPENEILLPFVDDPASLLTTTDNLNTALRHPKLDKPYLAEFLPISGEIKTYFRKEFAYDTFFLPEEMDYPELHRYLDMLVERAPGRPVLQFCRSVGRMKWMRYHFDATHLFLWRNPWDQWWSYKVSPYFDTANLLALNARNLPPVFQEIHHTIGLAKYQSPVISDEFAYFHARSLTSTQSYLVFYAFWLYAMFEGLKAADAILSIDELSNSSESREETIKELDRLGIKGISFSDCDIHRGWFGEKDIGFFRDIEQRVHEIFRSHQYSEETLRTITYMREKSLPPPEEKATSKNPGAVKEDLERSRQLIRQLESDASALKALIVNLQNSVARLEKEEAKLQSIYNSLFWKVTTPFRATFWKLRSLYRATRRNTSAPSTAREK